MKNADGRFQPFVIEIRVKTRQICGHHQPFVGHHLIRETANIKIRVVGHGNFGLASCHK